MKTSEPNYTIKLQLLQEWQSRTSVSLKEETLLGTNSKDFAQNVFTIYLDKIKDSNKIAEIIGIQRALDLIISLPHWDAGHNTNEKIGMSECNWNMAVHDLEELLKTYE
jgi:hypothetical protein